LKINQGLFNSQSVFMVDVEMNIGGGGVRGNKMCAEIEAQQADNFH
jgi:hypothetical protein